MSTKKKDATAVVDGEIVDTETGEVQGNALALVQPQEISTIEQTKRSIDDFIEARRHLLEKILPLMVKGTDFYTIRDKKSLGKPGAEKVASVYRLAASFKVDHETMQLIKQENWVAYVCTLTRGGEFAGEGRGAETLREANGDPNKMLKMAQKSAFIDAVIRTTGISDLFTQDIEDMPEFRDSPGTQAPARAPSTASAPGNTSPASPPPTSQGTTTAGRSEPKARTTAAPKATAPVAETPTIATVQRLTVLLQDLSEYTGREPKKGDNPNTGYTGQTGAERALAIKKRLEEKDNGGNMFRNNEAAYRSACEWVESEITRRKTAGESKDDGLPF